jgi:hypothetical protein
MVSRSVASIPCSGKKAEGKQIKVEKPSASGDLDRCKGMSLIEEFLRRDLIGIRDEIDYSGDHRIELAYKVTPS